jgi:hypothetical protein
MVCYHKLWLVQDMSQWKFCTGIPPYCALHLVLFSYSQISLSFFMLCRNVTRVELAFKRLCLCLHHHCVSNDGQVLLVEFSEGMKWPCFWKQSIFLCPNCARWVKNAKTRAWNRNLLQRCTGKACQWQWSLMLLDELKQENTSSLSAQCYTYESEKMVHF